MKKLLNNNPFLNDLSKSIKTYSEQFLSGQNKLNLPVNLTPNEAARIIQRTWRGKKVEVTIVNSPYFSYISLIHPKDEQRQLAEIMFGRHVAEQRYGARERVDNPNANTGEYYHRTGRISNLMIETFFQEFGIPDFDPEKKTYLPITLLQSNPIAETISLLRREYPDIDIKLMTKEPYAIGIIAFPNATTDNSQHSEQANQIQEKIKNMGLVASSWEIAQQIKQFTPDYIKERAAHQVQLDPKLPKTKDELLNSHIMIKLNGIALLSSKKYPTKVLAKCIQRLVRNLPQTNPQAIQRIALMIDLANTFYSKNYPRYAFCVYAIIHEISLALLKNTDSKVLDQEYADFYEESYNSLLKILGLDENKLKQSTFITAASTSGVSACAVAVRIVSKMKTEDNTTPKVKIFKPGYYELPNISNLPQTENTNEADVFMISAGPIVNPEGLTPGIDINQFVRRNIIRAKRTKPVSIVIDATTSLYKNIKLDPEVQKLVEYGKVSIIIHESHQKFGLLHSDQAQYGRVFGWCSNKHFNQSDLDVLKKDAKTDFDSHIDIRTGAFISSQCGEILEDIKSQHFTNGAILRNILIQSTLVDKNIVSHEDMLRNLDELYFLDCEEKTPDSYTSDLERAAFGVIDFRASFGHYAPTTTGVVNRRRLSPDASDALDSLVQACHIRLALEHTTKSKIDMLISGARDKDSLSLEEQIVLVGFLNTIITNFRLVPESFANVRFTPTIPTDEDKRQIINPAKNPKDILFFKVSEDSLRLGYCSYNNQFKQIEISDPQLLKMINDETITKPENKQYIRKYLHSLQQAAIPQNSSLAVLFAAVSNAVDCVQSLKNRQYVMNIHNWLYAIQDRVINQYKPQKPQMFINVIRNLYSLRVPLISSQLTILGQYPEACEFIRKCTDGPSIRAMIKLIVALNKSTAYLSKLNEAQFTLTLLEQIRQLYQMNVQLDEEQLNMISKHPEILGHIERCKNDSSAKALIDLAMLFNDDNDFLQKLENKTYITPMLNAVSRLYELNAPIERAQLTMLTQSPDVCQYIVQNCNHSKTANVVIKYAMVMGQSADFIQNLNDKQFIEPVLDAIAQLYTLKISATDDLVKMLNNQPEVCTYMKSITNSSLAKDILSAGLLIEKYAQEDKKNLDITPILDTIIHLRNQQKRSISKEILDTLIKHPGLCKHLKNIQDTTSINVILQLSMSINEPVDFARVLKNQDFMTIISKVYTTNQDILKELRSSPAKYKAAAESSKNYIQTSFAALFHFYNKENPNNEDKNILHNSIKRAKSSYAKVLGKDRSAQSQTVRYLLMLVTNFIASLTLGAAHAVNYTLTGTATFFSDTKSKRKLEKAHHELARDLENLSTDNNSSKPIKTR